MSQESFITRALDFLFASRKQNVVEKIPEQEQEKGRNSATARTSEPKDAPGKDAKQDADVGVSATKDFSAYTTSTADRLPVDEPLFTPSNVMRALGVEIIETGKDGYYMVGFQGGVFVMFFEDNRLNVMYNDVVECSYSDTVKASLVANEINSAYAVWSCYLHTSTTGSSHLPVKVCFSQMFPLCGNFKRTTEFIHEVMTSVFAVGREFRERFNRAQKDKSNLTTLLNQRDFVYKLELAKRLMEVQNFDEIKDEMPPASYLCIETLADLFDDTEFGEPLSLKWVSDNQFEQVTDKQIVKTFDIRSFVRNYPNRKELEHLTFIVSFEKQDLVISMKKMPGSSSKSLFFALNVMRSGVEDDILSHNRAVISCRDTIEIRLTTEQEDYWEVKYMLDEARDKHNKGDFSSMTDEQKMMLIQLAPNAQDDLYWGFKFFNQDCLFQSLYYFKRIYYNYSVSGKQGKRNEEALADISLYIGIAYCQLKRFELAYYYLNQSRKYDSIIASEWFTNCLCSLKDPRALTYIQRMIETVSRNMEEIEMETAVRNDLFKYYLFLKRRLVQTLISEQRLGEAERVIAKMIRSKENIEFCKKEQKRILSIRQADTSDMQRNVSHDTASNNLKDTDREENHGKDYTDQEN